MNLLEAVVLVFTVYLAISGFRRGFVRKLTSMLSLVLSIALVSIFFPAITGYLKEKTPVYDYIVGQCKTALEKQISEKILQGGNGGASDGDGLSVSREQIASVMEQYGFDSSALASMSDEEIQKYLQQYLPQYTGLLFGDRGAGALQLPRIVQTEIIEQLPLPVPLKDILTDYNNEEGYRRMNVSGFQDYLVNFIATGILNVAAFLLSVVVVQLLLWVIFSILNIVSHIPVIRVVNRLAGLLLGLLQAVLYLWGFFLILALLSGTEPGIVLLNQVEQSEVLCTLYESNLFTSVALRAAAFFIA